ncbi:hypothetical protein [Deinococcus multiflagellatus]|uniref:Uncharacterized protein n=1 Tax=Deinococcus multiflagellatus TaxID=1656887 RepID=A0ABW1ZIU9_9DEIO|nr:hypothetical protein [Deinococcus multiflagellatus]MBZ9713751.1 hypothetical protein [Deinococcus multiflagellatus]
MLLPVREHVHLSRGVVTLAAWPATLADAHLMDLLTLSATLVHLQSEWHAYTRQDVESPIWATFWRLVQASLVPGSRLPRPITWADRLLLLDAMWRLNDLEDVQGKLMALAQRSLNLTQRVKKATTSQGPTTPHLMN